MSSNLGQVLGLGRRNSGRDKSKPLPNLDPDLPQQFIQPASHEPISYYLVVCGARKPADGYVFGDFMGFCWALMEKGVRGRFISCFPLNEHFAWLAKEKPGIIDVKFGKTTARREDNFQTEPICRYTKQQYDGGDFWWEQVGVREIKSEILGWMDEKAIAAVSGDTVNVIIEGHGNRKGLGLCVGVNTIHLVELSGLLEKFKQGVQVNVITGACHSGAIADLIRAKGQQNRYIAAACAANEIASVYKRSVSYRLRNSLFSQAFCQSLARMKMPGVPQSEQPRITLGEHNEWMRVMTMRNISPGHANGLPSNNFTHYEEPNDLNILVEAMIFRDKIDALYDPTTASSRRRIEYPTINEAVVAMYRKWGPDHPLPNGRVAKGDIVGLVKDEMSKCDLETPLEADRHVVEHIYHRTAGGPPDYCEILKMLYWRGRMQYAVWDVFGILCQRGFLSPECLRTPMTFYKISDQVSELQWLLSCYEGPQTEEYMEPPPFEFHNEHFSAPLTWLATMILRGCADKGKLFENITLCGFLGPLNEKAFEQWFQLSRPQEFACDPQQMAHHKVDKGYFGFWLPHGLGNCANDVFATRMRSQINRFNRIEEAFVETFEIPQDQIWLERDQEDYFLRSPHKMPGFKTSGDWSKVYGSSWKYAAPTPPSTIGTPVRDVGPSH